LRRKRGGNGNGYHRPEAKKNRGGSPKLGSEGERRHSGRRESLEKMKCRHMGKVSKKEKGGDAEAELERRGQILGRVSDQHDEGRRRRNQRPRTARTSECRLGRVSQEREKTKGEIERGGGGEKNFEGEFVRRMEKKKWETSKR